MTDITDEDEDVCGEDFPEGYNAVYEEFLDTPTYCSDVNKEITPREYFGRVLAEIWQEFEGFSGKRLLGNSGWEDNFFSSLLKLGLIEGKIVDEGTDYEYVETDMYKAGRIIGDIAKYALTKL